MRLVLWGRVSEGLGLLGLGADSGEELPRHLEVEDDGDDLELCATEGAEHGVNLVHLADELRPGEAAAASPAIGIVWLVFGWRGRELRVQGRRLRRTVTAGRRNPAPMWRLVVEMLSLGLVAAAFPWGASAADLDAAGVDVAMAELAVGHRLTHRPNAVDHLLRQLVATGLRADLLEPYRPFSVPVTWFVRQRGSP